MEIKRPSEVHSLPGSRRERDSSEHEWKLSELEMLTLWRPYKERPVKARKEIRARGTHSLRTAEQREGLVRLRKESNQARYTHFLEAPEAETC